MQRQSQTISLSADKISPDKSGDVGTIYSDILRTHILTRLDGVTLAAAGCASSGLYTLAADQSLWRKICTSTWPSITDPRVSQAISKLPSGYRSFFSDSYPLIHHHQTSRRRGRRQSSGDGPTPAATSGPLISAVDVHYKGATILSKVVETDTKTRWFHSSPFRVDLLECKEFAQEWAPPLAGQTDTWLEELEANVTLSWLIVDPRSGRSMNVASQRPVSAQRHWLTGEVQLKFSVVVAGGDGAGGGREYVECGVAVTCGGREGGEVHVREVCLGVEDFEGRGVCGRDSLVILLDAMEKGLRKKRGNGKEEKLMFEQFERRRRDWKVIKQREEQILDFVCLVVGLTIFFSFWSFILLRR